MPGMLFCYHPAANRFTFHLITLTGVSCACVLRIVQEFFTWTCLWICRFFSIFSFPLLRFCVNASFQFFLANLDSVLGENRWLNSLCLPVSNSLPLYLKNAGFYKKIASFISSFEMFYLYNLVSEGIANSKFCIQLPFFIRNCWLLTMIQWLIRRPSRD